MVQTVRGEISSSWELIEGVFKLDVQIPANSKTQVSIPKRGKDNIVITENGKTVWYGNKFNKGIDGVTKGVDDGDYVTLSVGSGNYSFQASTE
jgi:hypothetical protein